MYTWMANLFFFSFFASLSVFSVDDPEQFQGSYGKFVGCDENSLGFCSNDCYGIGWLYKQCGHRQQGRGAGEGVESAQDSAKKGATVTLCQSGSRPQSTRLALARIPVTSGLMDSSQGHAELGESV